MDEKEDRVEDTVKAIESRVEKLEKIERELGGRVERETQSSK